MSDRPEWIETEEQWRAICALDEVPALKGLPLMMDESWVEWVAEWNNQPSPGIWHATRPGRQTDGQTDRHTVHRQTRRQI